MKEIRRLQYTEDRERKDSLSIMILFDEGKLPERIFLGYISYAVCPFVPHPLRCYKCQRYGHVVAVCRGKLRCARCGGEHSAGYGGCQVRQKMLKV